MRRKRKDRRDPLTAATERPHLTIYYEQSNESFSSAIYSKWDDNHAWSSQEWKTDIEMCERSGDPL